LIDGTLQHDPSVRPTASEVAMGLQPLVAELPHKMSFSRRGTQFR